MPRRLGQHFLASQSALERIAAAACAPGTPVAIEVGPGRGALTACLLERAARLVAIEVDPVLIHYLRQKFRDAIESGRLTLIEGDVLQTDLSQWGPAVVAGNLPYYITSPILDRVFAPPALWTRAVFLVQSEVAQRLAAAPGSRDYGYLSVLAQVHAQVEVLFDVPRTAFRPPPKVDSTVVRLEPRDPAGDFGIADPKEFLRFASACFRHKRKTLRNNLRASYPADQVDALVEGRLRAEQIGIKELAAIFARLNKRS
ncbi:MAG TPA: 16S rRNA (adenine(1518)-N(6)/adenine(1519)-N(6))-dimethyltransferase RsmA [Bryobacteraceae bacterium]|nr:16S rRNA (adenine(1518)-N(6)/adenine(1519)-N(6))-dimethyltransferase RsmA [Bryobacteraceae bacterium]